MSEENKELSPDELMAQQFADMGDEQIEEPEAQESTQEGNANEKSEELSPDELMAQQFAQMSYNDEENTKSLDEFGEYEKSVDSKLSLLLDIPLEITVEIGSTQMPLEDVLKLNPNSVIELDRYVNEPIDLKVNGRVIAKGELYTVKNNFGIKITHIIKPEDRLKILER
ncbi:flagellar motor switch protein FliN/FliY [Nitratiruptor sp. YY08-26]|uniref:flagellar motor switch protein FliN n=1 Tax=unclassified Nitratiruptor TaxID=2624044 RepID=UPI001936D4DF|nr:MULTISPECIES: flagellar motor switch protein FliN [unclassified Nitratiruptor]BCD61847.1 flagellar motor switch protein FliN/FliY [Nitratiruptor sp. YY08-13]BCD65782.1 flagellar motor switch protein FliN/FliY [Nitratiruptor sp. YY08-26]